MGASARVWEWERGRGYGGEGGYKSRGAFIDYQWEACTEVNILTNCHFAM